MSGESSLSPRSVSSERPLGEGGSPPPSGPSARPAAGKPQNYRRFSKRLTVAAVVWGMAMPILALFLEPDLFGSAMTGGVSTILGAMTAYQGTGHFDYRAHLRNGEHADIPPVGYQEGG